MPAPLDEIVWRTPHELLSAHGFATWEAFSKWVGGRIPDLHNEARVLPADDDTGAVQVGVDHPDAEIYHQLDLPLSMSDLVSSLREVDHLCRVATAIGVGPRCSSIDELLAAIGVGDLGGVVDWANDVVLAESEPAVSAAQDFAHVDDPERDGLGLNFWFHGDSIGALFWFPLSLSQLRATIVAVGEYAVGTIDYSLGVDDQPDILQRLPFLSRELEGILDQTRSQSFNKDRATRFVGAWITQRLQEVLAQLPQSIRSVLAINVEEDAAKVIRWATLDSWIYAWDEVPHWVYDIDPTETLRQSHSGTIDPKERELVTSPPVTRRASTHLSATQAPTWLTLVPCALAVLMLVAAYGAHPYSFFETLRWVVTGCALLSLLLLLRDSPPPADRGPAVYAVAVMLVGLVLIFNPVAPVELDREVWFWLDALGIATFVAAGFLLAGKSSLARTNGA